MKNNKDKWVFVTKNMNNVYLFLNSIHAEFRVAIIKQLVKLETVHPLLARHQKLFDIVKKDINDSNKKK